MFILFTVLDTVCKMSLCEDEVEEDEREVKDVHYSPLCLETSCVPMKSKHTMPDPPLFSDGTEALHTRLD